MLVFIRIGNGLPFDCAGFVDIWPGLTFAFSSWKFLAVFLQLPWCWNRSLGWHCCFFIQFGYCLIAIFLVCKVLIICLRYEMVTTNIHISSTTWPAVISTNFTHWSSTDRCFTLSGNWNRLTWSAFVLSQYFTMHLFPGTLLLLDDKVDVSKVLLSAMFQWMTQLPLNTLVTLHWCILLSLEWECSE